MAIFGHSGSHAPQLIHSSVIIVATEQPLRLSRNRSRLLRNVRDLRLKFWYARFVERRHAAPQSFLSHRKPVHDFRREPIEFEPVVGRTIPIELAQPPSELARGTLVIAVEEVIEADRHLDQPLQEETIAAPGIVPEIFQEVVALEVTAAVEFLDPAVEPIIAHSGDYTQKWKNFQAFAIMRY